MLLFCSCSKLAEKNYIFSYSDTTNLDIIQKNIVVANMDTIRVEPGLVRLPNNDLVCLLGSNNSLYYKLSNDNGITWFGLNFIKLDQFNTETEAAVSLLPNGQLFIPLNFKNGRIGFMCGMFENDKLIITKLMMFPKLFNEYEYISSPLIILNNGVILLQFFGKNLIDKYNSTAIIKSTDGGNSWSDKIIIAKGMGEGTGYTESDGVQLSNGEIIIILRSSITAQQESYGKYYITKSIDNCKTWSAPKVCLNLVTVGRPSIVKTNSDRLFMVCRGNWNNNYARNTYQISYDKGYSWTTSYSFDNTTDLPIYRTDTYDAVLNLGEKIGVITTTQVGKVGGPFNHIVLYHEFRNK